MRLQDAFNIKINMVARVCVLVVMTYRADTGADVLTVVVIATDFLWHSKFGSF